MGYFKNLDIMRGAPCLLDEIAALRGEETPMHPYDQMLANEWEQRVAEEDSVTQDFPSDDTTDRAMLLHVQSKLTAVYETVMRGPFDPDYDVAEPLNDLLIYLEEALHPERPNPVDALVNAALDSLASGVLAASLDDAVIPFVTPAAAEAFAITLVLRDLADEKAQERRWRVE